MLPSSRCCRASAASTFLRASSVQSALGSNIPPVDCAADADGRPKQQDRLAAVGGERELDFNAVFLRCHRRDDSVSQQRAQREVPYRFHVSPRPNCPGPRLAIPEQLKEQ